MTKSGAFKTGEGPTGGSLNLVLSPATQTLSLSLPTPEAGGTRPVGLSPATQTLSLSLPTPDPTGVGETTVTPEVQSVSVSLIGSQDTLASLSGQSKTGEFVTGGVDNPGLKLLSRVAFRPATQALSLSLPTPEAGGTGPVGLSPATQTLSLSLLQADAGYESWVLEDDAIGRVTAESATNRTVSLTARIDSDALESTLRPLKTDEGKVDVIGTDDGGFRAIDRANGGNSFELQAPIQRQPLRRLGTVHVLRYEETLISQDVGEWDVDIPVNVRASPRL